MNAIVAVDNCWAIGYKGELLFHIKEDMKHFKGLTTGGTVVMGRKTLDSLPGGKALPDRRNIVLTRDPNFTRENVEVVHNVDELIALVDDVADTSIWVIGGEQIYRLLFDYINDFYVTRVDTVAENADVWFPNLEMFYTCYRCSEGEKKFDGTYRYSFAHYKKFFI
jgi:dihydrofolate reductase